MNGTFVEQGDILLNITGASIGRSSIVPDNFDEGNVNQHVSIIRLIDKTIREYIHLCIISPYIQNLIMSEQVGISREGLSMNRLKEFLIPIPPLAEQKRIVEKVEHLMGLFDELESKLRSSRGDSEKLMDSVVKGLLEEAAA
jgi:type I restriction enzyme S subunit